MGKKRRRSEYLQLSEAEMTEWREIIKTYYFPKWDKKMYCFPPVYFGRWQYSEDDIEGEPAKIAKMDDTPETSSASASTSSSPMPRGPHGSPKRPTPPVDVQTFADNAQQLTLNCLQALGKKKEEAMFLMSEVEFTLGGISGEMDFLMIHPRFGFLVGEVKSIGYRNPKMTEKQAESKLAEKVKKSIKQLNKAETYLRNVDKDVLIRKTVALPFISKTQLQKHLDSNEVLQKELCLCLGAKDTQEACRLCLCQEQLLAGSGSQRVSPAVEEWWQERMACKEDPSMSNNMYLDFLTRFCGPDAKMSVYGDEVPSQKLYTEGEALSEIGKRMVKLVITPKQLRLVKYDSRPMVCVTGPPGTGKSIVLRLKGERWLREGHDVHVVSTRFVSYAACRLIKHQLEKMSTHPPEQTQERPPDMTSSALLSSSCQSLEVTPGSSQSVDMSEKSQSLEMSQGSLTPQLSEGSQPPAMSKGSQPPAMSEGSQPSEMSEGSQPPEMSEGSQQHEMSEGSQQHEMSEGSQPPEMSEGSQPSEMSEGSQRPEMSEGSQPPEMSEGSQPTEMSEGYQQHEISQGSQQHELSLNEGTEEGTTISDKKTPGTVHFHDFDFYNQESDVDRAVQELTSAAKDGKLFVLLDEYATHDAYTARYKKLLSSLHATLGSGLHVWAASLHITNIPSELDQTDADVTVPLRCTRKIVERVERFVNKQTDRKHNMHKYDTTRMFHLPSMEPEIRNRLVHRGGVDGHTGDWPVDCFLCGTEVRKILVDELKVGKSVPVSSRSTRGSRAKTTEPASLEIPLSYKDVFVLTRSTALHDASPFVRGLEGYNKDIPVMVISDRIGEDNSHLKERLDEVARSENEGVVVARSGAVCGLQRTIVVVLPGKADAVLPGQTDPIDDGKDDERLSEHDGIHAMSRATAHLIIIKREARAISVP